ncbi:MAG: hypothetical protein IJE88_08295 [Akkermansia sp.]|nr:hypothetical protein [Akkermansia sp.]
MMRRTLLAAAAVLPALATELPPTIPDGPIEYSNISYDNSYTGYDSYAPASYAPAAPMAAASSDRNGYVNLNAYTSDYQVRGMGVKDSLSKYGTSSVSASWTLPNRNLFGRGIHQRISGEYGVVWDASCPLGDTPTARLSYAVGKELFPNLVAEIGYTFRHGGLEGYMARNYDGASHRSTQEIVASLAYNDHQKGFFGKLEAGAGFYGLTGLYFDAEAGYRFTDVMTRGNIGADLELSFGVAPSHGYWGSDVEGVDAYRIKAALQPYSQTGTFGRDARAYVTPWIQCSWSGTNAAKIDRATDGAGLIDHFQITFGVDCGLNF